MYRQGDVLLVPVDGIPTDAVKQRRQKGRLILAEGEVTGHHHAIAEPDVQLLETTEVDAKARRVFLSVMEAPAVLIHEEHAAIAIPPGNYEVVIQREYRPTEIVRVAD